ncbi:MAG: alginate lyase family protein [Acidobacteriota bacterium]
MSSFTRRDFLISSIAAAAAQQSALSSRAAAWDHPWHELASIEHPRVLRAADHYLHERPKTITAIRASRSAGGLHDFYSEGDYWWPDPANPGGPYIRRDGQSNPDNFVAHRELLLRFSIQMPALTAAWLLTRNAAFAERAVAHLRAWFITPATHMNPNLEYAQAIHGRNTGRSIGIIDTVHLVEVAQAALILEQHDGMKAADRDGVHAWFGKYLDWLTNTKRGHQERDQKNNHGSCWLLQAAAFATYTGNQSVREACRSRFETDLVPNQIAKEGSLPLELARTKPYSYSLFDLDILGMSAQVLSDRSIDLWRYRTTDGRGLDAAFRFMFPYIENKSRWPYRHDVEYFDDLPVRQPSLLFAGLAYGRTEYLEVWRRLNPDPTVPEVIRNHPIRQPLLWMQY